MKLDFDPMVVLGALSAVSLSLAVAIALSACGGGADDDLKNQRGACAPPAVTGPCAFARDRLHANHLFRSKVLTTPLVPCNNRPGMFRSPSLPRDAAGGLGTACPSSFTAGCANLL